MQKGEGTITTDKRTGRKRVRVSINGQRVSIPGSFADEKQARGAVAEFWRLRAATQPASSTGLMTVAEWGQRYLDERETDGIHRSVDRDRKRWNARIAESAIAKTYIDTLTPKEVRAWVKEQIKNPSARGTKSAKSTIANALNLLRVALEAAVEAELIESNPARDVRLPSMARDKEGWDWLRTDEMRRLLGSPAATAEQRRILTTAVFTGLRKGELWGLRWSDVDFERGELVVSKSYSGPTKGGVVRRVPLLPPALEAIRAQERRCTLVFPTSDLRMRGRSDELFAVQVRDYTCEICGKLFSNARPSDCCSKECRKRRWYLEQRGERPGARRSRADNMLKGSFASLLKAAGITRHIRFHDLRHTCASHLLQGTWAPQFMDRALRLEEVQRWLGHRSIRTTERYAHLCDEAIRGRVKRASREPSPEGERSGREWTPLDTGVSEEAMQLAEVIVLSEARTGFEPVYDGFANRADPPKVSKSCLESRPIRDRILALLGSYARKERPQDMDVIRVLAEALAEASAEPSRAGEAAQ